MINTKAESFAKIAYALIVIGLIFAAFTGQFKATLAVLANISVLVGAGSFVVALRVKYKN